MLPELVLLPAPGDAARRVALARALAVPTLSTAAGDALTTLLRATWGLHGPMAAAVATHALPLMGVDAEVERELRAYGHLLHWGDSTLIPLAGTATTRGTLRLLPTASGHIAAYVQDDAQRLLAGHLWRRGAGPLAGHDAGVSAVGAAAIDAAASAGLHFTDPRGHRRVAPLGVGVRLVALLAGDARGALLPVE